MGVARPGAGGVVWYRSPLWERLGEAPRVTIGSAPPGSGKTVLLRSWIGPAGLAGRAAWGPVGRDERDPQRLWRPVLDALRRTALGSALVRPVPSAPDINGWALIERLLIDQESLRYEMWLVVDDARTSSTPATHCGNLKCGSCGHRSG